MSTETVTVTLEGQPLKLPLSMAMLRALGHADVCPMYLASMAVLARRPLVLTLEQASTIVALGLQGAGVHGATPDAIWQAARGRALGCTEVSNAAMTYLNGFLTSLPEVETPPPPQTGEASPKE